jgi:Gpi18-like mannosyltransferase
MIDNPIKRHWWFFIPLTAFIGFRILLLIILYKLTGGSEFSSDVWVFKLGLDPFSVITFSTDVSGYSQPPLFPFLLFPFAFFSSLFFDDFLASRISFTCFELISFLIVSYLLSRSKEINPKHKFYVLLIMSFSPLGFMTGAIMRQEEAVVAIFVALVILLVKIKSVRWASFVTFLAIISSKILAGIIFFPLLAAAEDKRDVIVWGLFPTFIFIVISHLSGLLVEKAKKTSYNKGENNKTNPLITGGLLNAEEIYTT